MFIKSLLMGYKLKPTKRRNNEPTLRRRLHLSGKFAPTIYFVEMFLVGAVPFLVVMLAWETVGASTTL